MSIKIKRLLQIVTHNVHYKESLNEAQLVRLSHHIVVVFAATAAAATSATTAVHGVDLAEDRSIGDQLVVYDVPARRQEEERPESLTRSRKGFKNMNNCFGWRQIVI